MLVPVKTVRSKNSKWPLNCKWLFDKSYYSYLCYLLHNRVAIFRELLLKFISEQALHSTGTYACN